MRKAVLISLLFMLARLPIAAHLELSPDEAYYWLWSKRLAASYFDHPPMVAWLIAASTRLFGDGELAVRLPALLCAFVVSVALAATAWVLAPPGRAERAASFTALLASSLPALHGSALLITPDSPGSAFWALALLAAATAIRGRGPAWLLVGAALGLALLSKYTTVFFGLSLACLLFLDPGSRALLRTVPPWIAAVLALVIFLPVILWNRDHHWVSFLFQLHHGTGGSGDWHAGLEFLGGQLGVLTPTLAAVVVMEIIRGGSAVDRQAHRLLLAAFLPMFAILSLLAFKSRAEVNWAAFAYLSCLPMAGLAYARATGPAHEERWTRGLCRATVGMGVFASMALSLYALHPFLPLETDRARTEFHGWRARGTAAAGAAGGETVLLGTSYRDSSELAYYAGGIDRVGVARLPNDRKSMFDLWELPRIPRGGDALFVSWYSRTVPPDWASAFQSTVPLPLPAGVPGTMVRLVSLLSEPPTTAGSLSRETP